MAPPQLNGDNRWDPTVFLTYKSYRLDPKSSNIAFLAGKYAALSLRALVTDPASFGMSYSIEAAWTTEDWIKRITRPNVHFFICVAHPAGLPAENLKIENGEWVGMVVQIGPTPKEQYWIRKAGSDEPLDDEYETKWHQTSTWNDPAHRGKGLAKQLINTAIAYAASTLQGNVRQARIRAITGPTNMTSMSLYGKRDFPQVGLCTISEAMGQNGNVGYPFMGRDDWPEEVLSSRAGIVMERVIQRGEIRIEDLTMSNIKF